MCSSEAAAPGGQLSVLPVLPSPRKLQPAFLPFGSQGRDGRDSRDNRGGQSRDGQRSFGGQGRDGRDSRGGQAPEASDAPVQSLCRRGRFSGSDDCRPDSAGGQSRCPSAGSLCNGSCRPRQNLPSGHRYHLPCQEKLLDDDGGLYLHALCQIVNTDKLRNLDYLWRKIFFYGYPGSSRGRASQDRKPQSGE